MSKNVSRWSLSDVDLGRAGLRGRSRMSRWETALEMAQWIERWTVEFDLLIQVPDALVF